MKFSRTDRIPILSFDDERIIEKKKLDIESIGKRNQLNWKEVRLQTLMR